MATLPEQRVRNVYDDITRCEAPLPNLNSASIFLCLVWGQTAKFKDRQYFWLHSMQFMFVNKMMGGF